MPSVKWNREVWWKDFEDNMQGKRPYYGSHWGDLEPRRAFPPLMRILIPEKAAVMLWSFQPARNILNRWLKPKVPFYPNLYTLLHKEILPFVNEQSVVLEIGPGGGRWTQYMLKAKKLILVDLVPEFFGYLKERFPESVSKFEFYLTTGTELNGIADHSIDFLLTFDTFVHVEPEGIQEYLRHIERVLKPGCRAVIHYGDKNKEHARNPSINFSPMTSELMEQFVSGLKTMQVITHHKHLFPHSNVFVLEKRG